MRSHRAVQCATRLAGRAASEWRLVRTIGNSFGSGRQLYGLSQNRPASLVANCTLRCALSLTMAASSMRAVREYVRAGLAR